MENLRWPCTSLSFDPSLLFPFVKILYGYLIINSEKINGWFPFILVFYLEEIYG
jgi:hypothetical protein